MHLVRYGATTVLKNFADQWYSSPAIDDRDGDQAITARSSDVSSAR
jgi:hypothetical protein